MREVYAGFTDRCEPFGMDECWLDMTGCVGHEDALRTAQEVRQRVLDAAAKDVQRLKGTAPLREFRSLLRRIHAAFAL